MAKLTKKQPPMANKQAECDYMYSALRRMQIRGHLGEVYAGIPKPSESKGVERE